MRVEHDEAAVGDLHEDVVAAGGVGHHFLDATFHYSEPERSVGGPGVSTRPLARGSWEYGDSLERSRDAGKPQKHTVPRGNGNITDAAI